MNTVYYVITILLSLSFISRDSKTKHSGTNSEIPSSGEENSVLKEQTKEPETTENETAEEVDPYEALSLNDLDGRWETACFLYEEGLWAIDVHTFDTEGNSVYSWQEFSDSDCTDETANGGFSYSINSIVGAIDDKKSTGFASTIRYTDESGVEREEDDVSLISIEGDSLIFDWIGNLNEEDTINGEVREDLQGLIDSLKSSSYVFIRAAM